MSERENPSEAPDFGDVLDGEAEQTAMDPDDTRLFTGDLEERQLAEDSTDTARFKGVGPINEQASDPNDGKKMGGTKGTGG